MNNEPLKTRFYRWLASWMPRELVLEALVRAFKETAQPAGNDQYHDIEFSLLWQRWSTGQERTKWFYWHWQNLNERNGKVVGSIWRHGRAWWRFFGDLLELHAEWSFFAHNSLALELTVADDERDISVHVAIPWLFGLWLSVDQFRPLRRWFRGVSRNFGYETGVRFHDGSIWIHIIYSEMWGSGSVDRKWLPRWIHIRKSMGYKEYPGVGYYVSISLDDLILGRRRHEAIKLWSEPIVAEIPIEPDNSLGFHYSGTFMAEKHTWWRQHIPFWKSVRHYVDIRTDNPPMHTGKGENSYDLDDDGIFGMGVEGTTLEEAIAGYQKAVARDRKRYGTPNYITSSPLYKRAPEEEQQ